ncbi:unnamed protein product [Lymnaea stagnalis]|uniref:Cilia- and flagella-associated protein 263 n=1 Tax=Lymnaea stagnalis TaxID=6523 RepID=A0AAV2I818_LYMST
MEGSDNGSVRSESAGEPFQDVSTETLQQQVIETNHAIETLQAETLMFEKYLERSEPPDSPLLSSYHGKQMRTEHNLAQRVRAKTRSSAVDKSLKLTPEQKCDIAQREIEELRDDINRLRDDSEKVLDTLKAIMEEADIRLSEVKKESYEFERDIVKGSVNHRTNKVIAEKCMRYFEDKLRTRDALIEKLRLKNAQLKVQKKKLMMQLRQKEEMGEVLNEVDFNQLKIENQQFLEKIDERNQDLLRLKLMAGNTLQVLNSYKKKLLTLTKESERLKSEINFRQDMDSRIQAETSVAETERAKAEQMNKKLRKQLSNFKVPSVMEYVKEKASMYELNKKVKSWERKVDIAEMALKTHRKTWQQIVARGAFSRDQWQGAIQV